MLYNILIGLTGAVILRTIQVVHRRIKLRKKRDRRIKNGELRRGKLGVVEINRKAILPTYEEFFGLDKQQ